MNKKIKIPEKVIGATRDSSGQLLFLFKWKGIEKCEIISAKEAYIKCPRFILRWYEERVTWDFSNLCHRLKDIVAFTINKLKKVGIKPKVVICDQGTNNISMQKLFGVDRLKPYNITFKEENIYFFHDSPHLIKSVINNFKKYSY